MWVCILVGAVDVVFCIEVREESLRLFGFFAFDCLLLLIVIGLQLEGKPFLFSHIAYDLLYRHANTAMNQNYTVLVGSG